MFSFVLVKSVSESMTKKRAHLSHFTKRVDAGEHKKEIGFLFTNVCGKKINKLT